MGICENIYLARAQSSNMADESLLQVFSSNNLMADTLPNTTWSFLRINTGKHCILLMIFIGFSHFLWSTASLQVR